MAGNQQTIRYMDIARKAGVTNSVVSSYFSGNYYDNRKGAVVGISKETRGRIKKACRDLGFRPKDPGMFIEIYPEEADVIYLLNRDSGSFSNPFYSQILDGLVDEAQTNRVSLGLGWFEGGIDYCVRKDAVPRVVQNNPGGKFILAGQPNYSLIMYLVQAGARIVYISRYVEIKGVLSIVPDYRDAAQRAIRYLKQYGHSRIGIVADAHFHPNDYNSGQLIRGCADELGEMSFEEVIHCAYTDAELESLKGIFKGPDAPTAVFCFDDSTVIALMRNLSRLGINVPERLSIVSCTNEEQFTSSMNPHVTGIALPMYAIGKSAFHQVTKLAVGSTPENAELEIFPVHLVERGSVHRI